MKKIFTLILIFISVVFISSCEDGEDAGLYNAEIKIDSLHQDIIHFGDTLIPGNLHVYYSVVNNDFADIYSYTFTLKAMNVDSVSYSYVERSTNVVPGYSTKSREIKMGIGGKGFLEAKLENETFE